MPKNTTINGAVYLRILMDKLPPFVPIHGITHFQHDGAPCHGTKAVKDWLRSENIPLLEPWPGNSPDLNIIENVWTLMKQKIAAHSPSSEDDLINWIKRVSQSTGNCLYSSISLVITGNNSVVNDLRLLTSIEFFLNADFYSNHPTF
ncbi:uncharacterized protein LOC136074396 [Hydra vulgaris]|uniref:Uncharacterized protein LOC136074396 n=1 Tax=Hydra vulgaris TaxID=6087 RepID=A0ABM4B1W9_HYDVU